MVIAQRTKEPMKVTEVLAQITRAIEKPNETHFTVNPQERDQREEKPGRCDAEYFHIADICTREHRAHNNQKYEAVLHYRRYTLDVARQVAQEQKSGKRTGRNHHTVVNEFDDRNFKQLQSRLDTTKIKRSKKIKGPHQKAPHTEFYRQRICKLVGRLFCIDWKFGQWKHD